ncbi:TetR/AcrR family transcriptional regulator C-terminal domain-containing protein [Saccharomonospora sp. NPDC046836]|uniref:TetR/AcrR family transcriptional regulator C-terminal domain-containing protein n=1 Tax=Saccharomonospora sp. NPDC046836 TaxID=3156921 RepID=UPI0033D0FE8E
MTRDRETPTPSWLSDPDLLDSDRLPQFEAASTRRPRTDGERTRAALVNGAIPLFLDRGYDGVSVADIAAAVGAYPNNVTYHFGGKDALFVESACRALLRTARQAELRTRSSRTVEEHTRSLISFLLGPGSGAVMLFADAMLMARRKEQLRDLVRETLRKLHVAGEAAMVDTFMRTGWKVRTTPEFITRGFWTAILGLALEKAALGETFEYASAEAVAVMMVRMNASSAGDFRSFGVSLAETGDCRE